MNPFSALKSNLSGAMFSKKITEVLNLLNETTLLVNRTSVKSRFEKQLSVFRSQLQKAPANPNSIQEVYAGITELRRQMRLLGYDLAMGKYTLIFDGFRNDEAFGSGFTRAVLCIGERNFFWKTGDENHIMLAAALDSMLSRNPQREQIFGIHYLWMQRTKTAISVSGSATETAEDYQKLKEFGEADSLLFLSKIKGLC